LAIKVKSLLDVSGYQVVKLQQKTNVLQNSNMVYLYTISFNSITMSQFKIWMALTILGSLLLMTAVSVISYAQMANETSMGNMTNATSMGGNATNSTGEGNWTGNISGCGKRC
jgi:hypothetical protein